jgi:tetratricopeptide (TPR) repeat protein
MFFFYLIHLFTLFYLPLWAETSATPIIEAQRAYQKGLQATTFELREEAFNQALTLYHQLSQSHERSSDLNRAIGDTYFQLEAYPWAILYYQRAIFSSDRDNTLLFNRLNKAYQTLGTPSPPFNLPHQSFLPSSTLYQLLFWSILFTLIILSVSIWNISSKLRYAALFSTMIIFLLLGNIVISYYLTPIEGIIVSSTGLYRAPSLGQPQLLEEPLLAGSKVQILQAISNGQWIKITLPSGLVGYVPFENMRII